MTKETVITDDGEKLHKKVYLKYSAILSGSVFDHLRPGTALEFIKDLESLLNPEDAKKLETERSFFQYVPSNKYTDGKDVVKFKDIIFHESILRGLHKKYPRFTYNIIEDGDVVEKYTDTEFRIRKPQALQANPQRTLERASG